MELQYASLAIFCRGGEDATKAHKQHIEKAPNYKAQTC
jgi:hypothetical protein